MKNSELELLQQMQFFAHNNPRLQKELLLATTSHLKHKRRLECILDIKEALETFKRALRLTFELVMLYIVMTTGLVMGVFYVTVPVLQCVF